MVRLPARVKPLFPYLKPMYGQATRMAAPTNQLLSRRRGGHLPSGVVPTLSEAAASTGGRYEQARAAEVGTPDMQNLVLVGRVAACEGGAAGYSTNEGVLRC